MVGTLSNDKAAFLSIRLGCTRLVQHGNNEVILGHQLVLLHKNCEPPTQVWLVFKYVEYLSKKKGLMGFCLQTVTSVENRYFLSNLARKILLRIIRNHSHWLHVLFPKVINMGERDRCATFWNQVGNSAKIWATVLKFDIAVVFRKQYWTVQKRRRNRSKPPFPADY